MTASFNTATGALPYPNDLFFAPTANAPLSDGTLNLPATIPWRGAAMRESLNTQDGWGTTATLDARFTLPLDASTINGSNIKIIKVWLDPATKAPAQNPAFLPAGATSPIAGVLEYGTDFVADIEDDIDSEGKVLRITPLKPFDYSRGPTANAGTADAGKVLNVGYIVAITNGIKATTGVAAQPDAEYAGYRDAANCGGFSGTGALVCQLVKAHVGVVNAVTGTDPADVVLTWGFSTQSIEDTMKAVAAAATATQTLIVPTGQKTPLGKADIYVGSTVLPYYLKAPANAHDASILTSIWQAPAGPNPIFGLSDTESTNVTMFNPMPAKQGGDQVVPVIVSVPNADSACAAKPAGGWPVAIVMHGITRNRSDAMAVADTFADGCVVVAAIDGPLHGITDPENPLYCTPEKPQCIGARERTFDLDILNNDTGANAPNGDGKIDSSGAHAINLTNPATTRDQLRQAAADIITFAKSLPGLTVAPGTPATPGPLGIDPTRIHYVGDSLGSIVGTVALPYAAGVRSATLEAPGGVLTSILFESPAFKSRIYAGLNAAGLVSDSYTFNLFRRDFQAVVDSGDPVNFIKAAQAAVPTHLMMWPNDTVVPNESTLHMIRAGELRRLTDLGPNAVPAGSGAYTLFSAGAHGSIFNPAANQAATVEAQTQMLTFAASVNAAGGPYVTMVNPEVLDLD